MNANEGVNSNVKFGIECEMRSINGSLVFWVVPIPRSFLGRSGHWGIDDSQKPMVSSALLLLLSRSSIAADSNLLFNRHFRYITERIILLHTQIYISLRIFPLCFLESLRLLAPLFSSFYLYVRTLSALKYCFASLRFASPSASAFVLAHPISVLKYHFASPSPSASASIHCFSRLDLVSIESRDQYLRVHCVNGTSTHRYPHSANLK